jgi:flagellar FliJ protein
MADLNPLIRVRKHVVDQKQKFLSELYRQAEELERQKQTLLDQMEHERRKLEEMGVEMLAYFGPYSQAVKERIEEIDESRTKLETRIELAREDMREAFSDLKKVEITQERREEEEQREQDRKETIELDDIGIDGFRRQHIEDGTD